MNGALASSEAQPDGMTSREEDFTVGLSALRALIESLEWPHGMKAVGMSLARVWSGRNRRITIEHHVSVEKDGILTDYPVQGIIAATVPKRMVRNGKPRMNNELPMGILLVDDASSCWLTSPDCDPELPATRVLFESQGPQRILIQAMAKGEISPLRDFTGLGNHAIKLISYRAGRRFVMRVRNADENSAGVYLKGFRRSPSPQAARRASDLAGLLSDRSAGQIRVPTLLGLIPDSHLLVFSEIWPRPTQTEYSLVDVSGAARVAALIHALPSGDDRVHSSADELNTVERWQQVLQVLRPDRAMPLQEILSFLRASQPPLSQESARVIHRDYYHSQLLRNEEAIWLTDWDTLCKGHPELDVATYVAHAILSDALANLPTHDGTSRLREFLAQYRASGAIVDSTRLGWYLACALTRMAAMYSARQYPDAAMAPLWQFAREFAECPHACLKRLDS